MANEINSTASSTSRNRKIIDIAQRETSVDYFAEFQPLTRGPIFAFLGLAMLGIAAAVYLVYTKLRGLFGVKS